MSKAIPGARHRQPPPARANRRPWMLRRGVSIAVVILALAACGQSTSSSGYNAPFGGPQNHFHDLLALRGIPDTVLLATHAGLYRTTNGGGRWTEVAGGPGQQMDGLMLFKFAQSPADAKRVYVLAVPRTDRPGDARATTGLYSSADAGQTWHLAAPLSHFPTKTVYTIGAGSGTASQVYALVTSLGEHGLYASDDLGAQWHPMPTLPDSHPTGMTGDPTHPGRIILWSASTGVYTSEDAGQTWRRGMGTETGIFSVSLTGSLIYASGDAGMFVSSDDGANFTLANKDYAFSSVVACPAAPATAYALAGTAVYASSDSGQAWTPTAPTTSHPSNLTADPANGRVAYVGFSYPVGVATTTDGGAHWRTVFP